jgi:hypothetical protein
MPDPLATELVAILVALSGYPITYVLGYQMGRTSAPRRVVDFSNLVYAQQTAPAPVELVRTEARTFTRLRWRMLTRAQWDALLRTTATNELCGAGKPFERKFFDATRNLLIARRVAFWRNAKTEKGGWDLTPAMRRAIAHHLGYALPHRKGADRVGRVDKAVHTYMQSAKGQNGR